MFDLLKKTFLAGVGATVVTQKKLEAQMKDFVEKGKVSAEDAQKMAQKIMEEGEREYDEARSNFEKAVDEWKSRANFASVRKVEELEERVAALEAKLGGAPASVSEGDEEELKPDPDA